MDHQSIPIPITIIIIIMVATAELHAWITNSFLNLSSSSSSWWPQPSFTPGSAIYSYTYHHHHHGGHSRASCLEHQSIPTPIIIIVIMVATAELHAWITSPFLHLSSSSSWWPQLSFTPGSPIHSYTYHHHHRHGGHSRASRLDHQSIPTPIIIIIIIIIMVATAELHAWITNLFLHLSSSLSPTWWPQPSFTPGSPIHSYTYLHHHHHHGGHSQASCLDHQSISTPIIIIIFIMVATAKLHAWISNLFLHLSSSSLSSWWPQLSFTPGSPIHSYTYHHHHHHHHGGHGRASRLDHQMNPFLHLSSSSSSSSS